MDEVVCSKREGEIINRLSEKNYCDCNMRNRIEIASQALIMAAGIVLSVTIISIMVSQMHTADDLANSVGNNISEQLENIRYSGITQYDGLTVNGSDVVNFYKKNFDEYPIGTTAPYVIEIDHSNDDINNGIEYVNCSYSSEMRDSSSTHYIKPSSRWKCSVIKNKNGIITRVRFTKQ